MKSLNEDLKKGQFKQIYLFLGEEDYLKTQYKQRFIKSMISPDDTMNFSYYEGKNFDVNAVIDQAETMPFFAERRLLVLEETGLFKTGGSELGDYIKNLPETTYMIFVETAADKRSKLYKAVRDKGRIVEFNRQSEATLRAWIRQQVRAEKKTISQDAETLLLTKVGNDLNILSKELDKLFCYTLDKSEITKDDINEVCIEQLTNTIFDMIDAMTDGNQSKALNIYYGLLAAKESPMTILFLMTKQYRQFFEIKDYVKNGKSRADIAKKMGLHPFIVGKISDKAKKFRSSELRNIIEESADLEYRVKSGKLTDRLAVELFLIKYSGRY